MHIMIFNKRWMTDLIPGHFYLYNIHSLPEKIDLTSGMTLQPWTAGSTQHALI